MQKRNLWILAVIIVVVAAGISYAAFHKSPKPTTNSTGQTQTTAANNDVIITKSSSSLGSYLADPNGNTLYTTGTGSAGVTSCTGSCLSAWPAYQDTGSTSGLPANVGTIKRSDNGEIQYTYKNMPLYYFSSDGVGHATGNGVSGFSVAKP